MWNTIYIIRRQVLAGFKFISYFGSSEGEFIILLATKGQWVLELGFVYMILHEILLIVKLYRKKSSLAN